MTEENWLKQQHPDDLIKWQEDGSPTCPDHKIPMRMGLLPKRADGKMVADMGWRCPKCRKTP